MKEQIMFRLRMLEHDIEILEKEVQEHLEMFRNHKYNEKNLQLSFLKGQKYAFEEMLMMLPYEGANK